jgi:transcription antitermination protein NusB
VSDAAGSAAGRPAIGGRREARERALSLLYEADSKGRPPADVIAELPIEPEEFATQLALGVHDHLEALDALIRRFSKGWTLERMPVIDRTLLRMGTYELTERPDVPTGAVISEAVELAKRYSTDDSGRFVNGLLARIAEEVRPAGTNGGK